MLYTPPDNIHLFILPGHKISIVTTCIADLTPTGDTFWRLYGGVLYTKYICECQTLIIKNKFGETILNLISIQNSFLEWITTMSNSSPP